VAERTLDQQHHVKENLRILKYPIPIKIVNGKFGDFFVKISFFRGGQAGAGYSAKMAGKIPTCQSPIVPPQ